ncbi:MAG: dissimilatory sulfite reductase D family protein [Thermodesulfobacteriota bacterium]
MALSKDELKAAMIEKATKAPKPQLYVKDFYACDPDAKPREIKNVANELVKESKLMFWSSGSTTMYALPSRIKNEESRDEAEANK